MKTAVKPHIYETLVQPDKTRATRKVIIDLTGKIHVFASKDSQVPVEIQPDKVFDSLDSFAKQNKQTILAYHEQYLKDQIPKKQDIFLTACYIWAWFLKQGEGHLDKAPGTTPTGHVSKVLTRTYTIIAISIEGQRLPNQANVCLRILSDACKDGRITEELARAAIEQRASELKTRQDPWRIFQFYRPQLIKLGYVKHD